MSSLFSTSTTLPASAETMFAFHSDPHNLHHVMPPTLRVTDLITEVPAREGGRIEIRCRDWGLIPMHWVCRWKAVEPPHLLMDEMLQGPFRLFVHEHRFQPLENGTCLMQDHITYQWGSSWWGKLVSETFVRLYLIVLFRYRHHRTRQWALSQAKERGL